MSRHTRSRAWLAILPLVLTTASCSSDPPAPADQFKTISDGKKAQLTQFLEGKQSRLGKYTATVTEEPDVDKRADHTHVGRIEFQYAVTLPKGESQVQYLEAAEADYHFSTKEKKWGVQGVLPDVRPGVDGAEGRAARDLRGGQGRVRGWAGITAGRPPLGWAASSATEGAVALGSYILGPGRAKVAKIASFFYPLPGDVGHY